MRLTNKKRNGSRHAAAIFPIAAASTLIAAYPQIVAAQSIDTTTSWSGSSSGLIWSRISPASIGQVITATPTASKLDGFTFYVKRTDVAPFGSPFTFQAIVYTYEPRSSSLGTPIYTSAVLPAPTNDTDFTAIDILTGSLILAPGKQYVLAMTASRLSSTLDFLPNPTIYTFGTVANSSYTGGFEVFATRAPGFGFGCCIETSNWRTSDDLDLAFKALLSPALTIDSASSPYLASSLNGVDSSTVPVFEGGTLSIDQSGTYSRNFALDASAANTIDAAGHTATLSGTFVNADNAAPGNLLLKNSGQGGGTILTGAIGDSSHPIGTLINTASLEIKNGAQIYGALRNMAGGTVSVSGTITGAIVNEGTFNVAGALLDDGYSFTNQPGAKLILGTPTTSSTLRTASLSNAGSISMLNGHTGDRILTGSYAGIGGSTLSFDADMGLPSGTSDALIATNVSGSSTVSLQNVGSRRVYLNTPIVLISGAGTATFTASNDAATQAALAPQGIVRYAFQKIGNTNDWGIVASVDGGAMSKVASDTVSLLAVLNSGSLSPLETIGNESTDSQQRHVWVRAGRDGGNLDVDVEDSAGVTVRNQTKLDAQSFQMGADMQMSGLATNWRLGLTGGWIEADTETGAQGFGTRFKGPFYGAYAIMSGHHVHVALQALHQDLDVTPPSDLASGTLAGRGDTLNLVLSSPYKAGAYTILPYASYTVSQIKIDPMKLTDGTGDLHSASLNSTLSVAGIRLNAFKKTENLTLLPFASIGVANESGKQAEALFVPTGVTDPIITRSSRPGSFIQIGAGFNARFIRSGMEVYVRGDSRKGKSINGYTVTAGVRHKF